MSDRASKSWFDNGVALVTGAAVRVGEATALRLAKMGVNVAVHYRSSAEEAFETVERIRSLGVDADAFQADLCEGAEACRKLVSDVATRLGTPRILVNNASLFETSSLSELTEQHWETMLDINLRAPAFLCQAVTQRLEA